MKRDGQYTSICRFCHCHCPILVDVKDGIVSKVVGDVENTLFKGFSCIKGRQLPEQLTHPDRLLRSLKRMADGSLRPIPVAAAMDEIADRLQSIIEQHGPIAVANYAGTHSPMANFLTRLMANAFMEAIGSPWLFEPGTIDQPGKYIVKGLHGMWQAPPVSFEDSTVALLIGVNPYIAFSSGVPCDNPRWHLQDAKKRGMRIIVIDPRRTETARYASLFIQPRPAQDIAIVAAILHVILEEELYDKAFVADNVRGMDDLRLAVARYTPQEAAHRADVPVAQIVDAARLFAGGRGTACAGTGPSMSSARTTLLEYLVVSLNTICGQWQRAGDHSWAPGVLSAPTPHKAQATPPFPAYGLGEPMAGRGVARSLAGPPTAFMPDQMLTDGNRRIRALISGGGNPIVAWPDQFKTRDGLQALDLFVQVDAFPSASVQFADYVIAPKLPLEMPGMTARFETLALFAPGIGWSRPHAQYTAAIVDPPDGSEVIADWVLYFGLAKRLGLQLSIKQTAYGSPAGPPIGIDMSRDYDDDELFERLTANARIPLATVKQYPHGAVFDEPPVIIEPKDAGWTGRLDIGNLQMMSDLEKEFARKSGGDVDSSTESEFPFRLISRRLLSRYNSNGHGLSKSMARDPTNAAYMHPKDMAALGVSPDDLVEIRSHRAAIYGIVKPDDMLRPGLVSMAHCFGGLPEDDANARATGAPTGRLLDVSEDECDPYSGQPLMSNIPVAVIGA